MSNETDRELLELAAKAAEITLARDPHGVYRNVTAFAPEGNVFTAPLWNPLTDDGDALRLVVKLQLPIEFMAGRLVVVNNASMLHGDARDHGGDLCAATRRAIVRAAAEIGKQQPTEKD